VTVEHPVAAYARSVGETIESRWVARRYHAGAFPALATAVLAEVPVPDGVDAHGVLHYAATDRRLPYQEDGRAEFGQPPLTLYRSRDFFVSALYWLDGTTSVHQHGFSGAFRVLAGGSLHVPHGWETDEEITDRLRIGRLSVGGPEILRVGDVRMIEPGAGLIHSLFHLDRPSVTIVVRTYRNPSGQPQYCYLKPGLSFDPFARDRTLDRRIQAVLTLADVDRVAGTEAAACFVAGEDFWATFLLAQRWEASFGAANLEPLLEAAVRRHGSLAEALRTTLIESSRIRTLAARRRLLSDPDHRVLLAMALNLPDAASIRTALEQRYPGSDPGDLLATWIEQLASPALRGLSGINMAEADLVRLTAELRAGSADGLGALRLDGRAPEVVEHLLR
jgi:hypothetical protein